MRPFPIEELVDRVGSRFTVVVAAAKRAKQIKDGAPPLVNLPTRNALTIALHEIAAGLIKIGDAPPEVVEDRPEEPADLAAPEVVETLLERAATLDEGDIAEDIEDDYDSDLDEEIAADLDEDEELADEDEGEEEEEEELEETDLEAEDDWDEGEAEE